MEQILQQIADALRVSVETVVQQYPMIRGQFIAYDILGNIQFVSMLVAIIGAIALPFVTMIMSDDGEDYKPVAKRIRIAIGILLVIFLITSTLKPILAPDYMLIQRIIQ